MSKSVLITGCSGGIGQACAREFQKRGWTVAATMRNPGDGAALTNLPGVRVLGLDVTKPEQIESVVSELEREWGGIDALINNAGYGLMGPFETTTDTQVREQLETNLFGVFNP